ncbi:MAG TPA: RsmE family RNA methyltransferase [Actinomycetota bacterium]|nr:RsmE family RNA methyltransferase [Actinomycetota bacterium]
MSAHHFFLPSIEGVLLTIEGEDARHATRVLRIRPGEAITVSDGRGGIATATVTDASRALSASVMDRRVVEPIRPALTVYQALPKAGKLERVVQALTQCGVAAIVPLRAARSIAKWDAAKAASNVGRLRAVAREAAMQSRRAWLPTVRDPIGIDEVPAGTIVLHEAASTRLSALLPLASGAPAAVSIAIGPEGGFDDAEIAALEARGCPAATLGPVVLRTETASIVAAAVILARYGSLG